MMETTFSMFSPVQSRNMPQSLSFGAPEVEPLAMTEKHRPQRLSEMYGQSYAVDALHHFASQPYPNAFIFSGATGIGKTTGAKALARELGINPDCLWQFDELQSGDLTDEYVDRSLKDLRRCAPNGGWKMLLVEEADGLSNKARQRFLSCLEDLPARTCIVFTTNHEEKLDQRFLDRCERLRFESKADALAPDAQEFLAHLWFAEALPEPVPMVSELPGLVENGNISFRRIVRHVEACKRRLPVKPSTPVAEPIMVKSVASEPRRPSNAVSSRGTDPKSVDWDTIALRYLDGESQKALATELGVSHGCVFSRMKKMGIAR